MKSVHSLLWALLAAVAACGRVCAADSEAANSLYLVITNGPSSFSLTAYKTIPSCVYRIETNAELANPAGWGEWLRVTATGSVTPLASLSATFQQLYFRAVIMGPSETGAAGELFLGKVVNNAKGGTNAAAPDLKSWGRLINPDNDGKAAVNGEELALSVPGGGHPHDLASEIDLINSPRVVRSVDGDFAIQVRTDGKFEPGEISTFPGRRAYNGAALIIMAGPGDVVTLARAGLQYPEKSASYYGNLEMRAGGNLDRIGMSGDCRLPEAGPVYLKLEKRGLQITASTSLDGKQWQTIGTKTIPSTWPHALSAGVATISTSEAEFAPRFAHLSITP